MAKKSILAMLCLLAAHGLLAQSFSAVNDDSVTINYSVISPTTCQLMAGSYSGSLVVPGVVEYEGTSYTVTAVAENAFRRNGHRNVESQVTYLCLPATIEQLGNQSLYEAVFDSVRFLSEVPPTIPRNRNAFAVDNGTYPIYVPCGSLALYHTTNAEQGWSRAFSQLRSNCAMPIVGTSTHPDYVAMNSAYYELGDTATLKATTSNTATLFLGWSNGCFSKVNTFVVTGSDTLVIYATDVTSYTLDGNNVSTTVTPFGMMGFDMSQTNYFVPVADSLSTLFNATLWASGNAPGDNLVGNSVHASAQRFEANYLPGPLRVTDASTTVETALQYNRAWVVSRDMIDDFIAHVGEPGYQIPEAILSWPGEGDSTQGYASQLAPYYDANHDGRYRPVHGDYPLIRGDKAAFVIFNDRLAADALDGQPMGLEVHAMYYLFDEPADTALSNTLFADFTVINRSQNSYSDARLTSWVDFDLGYAFDDYIGCDVAHNMFYSYNGDEVDGPGAGSYVGVPPAQGCAMLGFKGHLTDESQSNQVTPMDLFLSYSNLTNHFNGEPTTAIDFYRYCNGFWLNGDTLRYGGEGTYDAAIAYLPCRYMYPGDSDPDNIGTYGVEVEPWTEATAGNYPGDRRGLASTGRFLFTPSMACTLSLAYTTAFGHVDVASSVGKLRQQYAPYIQQLFDRDTTGSGRAFTYMPYSPAHEVGVGQPVQASVKLYPNPAGNRVTLSGLAAGTPVQIYNMQGALVMAFPYNGATIDLTALPAGIYLLSTPSARFKLCKR